MKQLLTLEINGQCQLHCPHCYLDRVAWPETLMTDQVIDALLIAEYSQVAIVATEPFFNRDSLQATLRVGERARAAGKDFSVITNALGLERALSLAPRLATLLSWIDISMDVPGEVEYRQYRGGSWQKFLRGVAAAHAHGIEVRILNTVSERTLPHFTDMINLSESLASDFFTVSLMIKARSRETPYTTNPLASVASFFRFFANEPASRASEKVVLDIGQAICRQSGESMNDLMQLALELGIEEQVFFLDENPDDLLDRVTVTGECILPSRSLEAA